MNLNQAFGQAVRERRGEIGISQEALGFHAGIHRTYVSQLERGIKSPSLKIISLLARSLNISASELIANAEKLVSHSTKQS